MNQYRRLEKRLAGISHQKYLMHGSPRRRPPRTLMPRKQHIVFPNKPQLTRTRVYATAYVPVAIMYAIIGLPSKAWDWQIIKTDGKWIMYCRMLGRIPVRDGYIHIVPRKPFRELGSPLIYSSFRPVPSVERIRVPMDALPWLVSQGMVKIVREYPE